MRTHAARRDATVRVGWALTDALVVGLSLATAGWLRLDFDIALTARREIVTFAVVGAVLHLGISIALGLTSRRHPRGSFEETLQVLFGTVLLAVGLVVIRFATPYVPVPRSLPVTGPIFALVMMLAVRFAVRSYRWGRQTSRRESRRTIVVGAGEGGRQLLRALVRGNDANLEPVAVLDDDPKKRRWRIEGVRVRGGLARLADVAERTRATTVVLAVPSMSSDRRQEVHEAATSAGLEVLVLPGVDELLRTPGARDLRRIDLEDLLGRHRVALDESAISRVVMGRRVLVTGAGGSIGAELARQIARYGPSRLVLLDRDESALHACQLSMTGRALLDDDTLALVDIRDRDAVREVFRREEPEVVFHAAALKHLALLEQFPLEAWKTNVLGTLNVLSAAHATGVGVFVNISTDKAAAPTCVLGRSKRIAERLTAAFAAFDESVYVSVRFGNVLGSRGSVLDSFRAQIDRGGPVTVTHPDVERYFMLIPEASQLVLQAAAIGCDGEAMVLDMGRPVRILDVANTLIALSGRRDVRVDFTGLRPGEKLSEVLFDPDDEISESAHPLVSHVPVPALAPHEVTSLAARTGDEAQAAMVELAGTGIAHATRAVESSDAGTGLQVGSRER